jgi:hypothetical protein
MFTVELYAGIRRAVMVDSDLAFIGTRSRRCCSSRFRRVIGGGSGRHRRSSVRTWRGSTRSWKMTEERHTAHRIFERLRAEEEFSGGYTIVREYVARATLRAREILLEGDWMNGQA